MPETSVIFDRAAEFYDETRGFPAGEDERVGAFIAQSAGLSADATVLEIGIGTGRIALPLAKHIGRLVGVDLSMLMMERLREKQTESYAEVHLEVVQGDVMALPLAQHRFDAALIVHILHLVPQPERAVNELARVLRPNGKALQCWNSRDESYFEPIWKAWDEATHNRQQDGWQSSKSILSEVGWTLIGDEHVHPFEMWMSPNEMADRYRRRVWSSMWNMPDELWQQGMEAVDDALRSHYPKPEQKHEIPCRFHLRVYTPQ